MEGEVKAHPEDKMVSRPLASLNAKKKF